MPNSAIYAITHVPTGRIYVGSALNLRQRWKCHRNKLRAGSHENSYLQRAWRKHGEEAFAFTILEHVVEPTELIQLEQKWIDFYSAANRRTGFNICPKAGSHLGRKLSPEHRQKLSEIRTGRALTEQCKQRISQKAMGNRRGVQNLSAPWKLNDERVLLIFESVALGNRTVDVAAQIGVSQATVTRVLQRKIWAHVTIPQQTLDAISIRDKRAKGSSHFRSKFTDEIVLTIKKRFLQGEGCTVIARELGVHITTIESIKYGKTWRHITV